MHRKLQAINGTRQFLLFCVGFCILFENRKSNLQSFAGSGGFFRNIKANPSVYANSPTKCCQPTKQTAGVARPLPSKSLLEVMKDFVLLVFDLFFWLSFSSMGGKALFIVSNEKVGTLLHSTPEKVSRGGEMKWNGIRGYGFAVWHFNMCVSVWTNPILWAAL